MNTIPNDIITTTIAEFRRMSGLGNTKTYELIGKGELETIKIGKRRLILVDSYRKLIERRRATTSPPRTGPAISAAME